MDTGLCIAESTKTLLLQQAQLILGKRVVQMFPAGTSELPLPIGFARFTNERGVFHFHGEKISADKISALSEQGRENEFLNLGPYSKPEITRRALNGETPLCVTEYTTDGVELRSAAGTDATASEQREFFERTKESDSIIVIGDLSDVLVKRLRNR